MSEHERVIGNNTRGAFECSELAILQVDSTAQVVYRRTPALRQGSASFGLIGFGAMHGSICMFRRAVNGIQLKRSVTRHVDDIVLDARRNHHRTPVAELISLTIQNYDGGPGLDADKLVVLLVRFKADFVIRLQSHQHELHVPTGIHDTTIVLIVQCVALDIRNVSVHPYLFIGVPA